MSQEFDNKRDENAAKQSCRYDFEPCGDSYIEGASFGYDYRQEEIDELKKDITQQSKLISSIGIRDMEQIDEIARLKAALNVMREGIEQELLAMENCCCGAEAQDGEGYTGLICYLHDALERADESLKGEK